MVQDIYDIYKVDVDRKSIYRLLWPQRQGIERYVLDLQFKDGKFKNACQIDESLWNHFFQDDKETLSIKPKIGMDIWHSRRRYEKNKGICNA